MTPENSHAAPEGTRLQAPHSRRPADRSVLALLRVGTRACRLVAALTAAVVGLASQVGNEAVAQATQSRLYLDAPAVSADRASRAGEAANAYSTPGSPASREVLAWLGVSDRPVDVPPGECDTALIDALRRARSRRYTTYWASYGEPSQTEKELTEFVRGRIIETRGADAFFRDLSEKVQALEDYGGRYPMTAPLAVATAKRYLAEDRHRIRLHDLVTEEAERLHAGASSQEVFPLHGEYPTEEEFERRARRYREMTDVLLNLTVTGCYWDERPGKGLWEGAVERIANTRRPEGTHYQLWLDLRLYPALVLLYGGGLAAIAADNYARLAPLLSQARRRELNWEGPLVLRLNAHQFLARYEGFPQLLTRLERAYYPISEHLHETLREPLRQYLPDDEDYDGCFDRFEYFLALVYADLEDKRGDEYFAGPGLWGPIGRFGWRLRYAEHRGALQRLEEEAEREGGGWAPLRAGLFDGSSERFQTVMQGFDEFVRSVRR